MIKYSKRLQEKFNRSLSHYKSFSNKYIIYMKNGYGNECDAFTGELIFKGQYLNGERNGKGTEYDGYLKPIFMVDYLNGKRNGKGEEYGWTGKLVFQGEYKNGLRNGKGREYVGSDLVFEGEYIKNRRIIYSISKKKG